MILKGFFLAIFEPIGAIGVPKVPKTTQNKQNKKSPCLSHHRQKGDSAFVNPLFGPFKSGTSRKVLNAAL
jgi:hypothetical protein